MSTALNENGSRRSVPGNNDQGEMNHSELNGQKG
jgi:hypothetical protein